MSTRTRIIFALSVLLGLMGSQAAILFKYGTGTGGVALATATLISAVAGLVLGLNMAATTRKELRRDVLPAPRKENARPHQEALKMREDRILLLQEHLSRVVKAQEDERKRVARELHDQAGQALMAIQLGLGRIEKYAGDPRVRKELDGLRSLTAATMEEIRNLALDLRPSMLDELGLVPAVRQYTKDFTRRTGIQVELGLSPFGGRLPGELETTLFRVVQEGLTNIAKHSLASCARVTLEVIGQAVIIQISDNGRGFDVTAALRNESKRSLGLLGMEERIALLGGRLSIRSAPGEGTTLSMEVPLPTYRKQEA